MSTPLQVNFIGCGRLGRTLGKLMQMKKVAKIAGVFTSSQASALAAVQFMGGGQVCTGLEALPAADLHIIATPDDKIRDFLERLVSCDLLRKGDVVVHCSGALSSEILTAAKSKGCCIASIHPLKSFANPEKAIQHFEGTYCSVEGDEPAVALMTHLFQAIGGKVFQMNPTQKSLYHAASVIANNYLVTLHYQAVQAFISAGVDPVTAKEVTSLLMSGALKNLEKLKHEAALTGPLQRGDVATISAHLAVLSENPALLALYSLLGQQTLALTQHSIEIKAEFERLLNNQSK